MESRYLDLAMVELSAFLMCHVGVSMVIGVPKRLDGLFLGNMPIYPLVMST